MTYVFLVIISLIFNYRFVIITLFSHVGRFHDLGICQLYSMGPRSQWEYSFIVNTFKLNLEIWVELESGHYAQELLFIPRILSRNNIHPSIIP